MGRSLAERPLDAEVVLEVPVEEEIVVEQEEVVGGRGGAGVPLVDPLLEETGVAGMVAEGERLYLRRGSRP